VTLDDDHTTVNWQTCPPVRQGASRRMKL